MLDRKLGPHERCLIVIKTNGEVTYEPLTSVPGAERLHEAIGGYLEVVPMFTRIGDTPCVAFCKLWRHT